MNHVLRIDASMRAEQSHSRKLLNHLMDRFDHKTTHIQYRDLSEHLPLVNEAWIDMVARAKETFHYTADGPEGLLQNKRAIIVITSGGTKLGSDIDFVSGYLRHVFAFIGIKDLTFVDASGINRNEETVLARARQQIDAIKLHV